MKLWPVEHFWLTFFPDQHWICAALEKKWAKSVQLVKVSFFRSDFLQNPYFSVYSNFLNFCSEFCLPTYIRIRWAKFGDRQAKWSCYPWVLQCSLDLVTSNVVAVLQKIVFNLLHTGNSKYLGYYFRKPPFLGVSWGCNFEGSPVTSLQFIYLIT